MGKVNIRPLAEADHGQWLALYGGYAEHYRMALTEDGTATTWGWLIDAAHPLRGLVAEDGKLLGLAHYRAMPSPLRGTEIGFLDDLFVARDARGSRIGADLLEGLRTIAKREGWPCVRWITRDDNYRARTLYDRHAAKTDWNLYEMPADGKADG